jgi:signal transduction histidine kinase
LTFQGPHQGSISLFNKLGGQGLQPDIAPRLFDRDDLELLFSMNNMISGVLENAITFREVESLARDNEKIITNLSILYEISSAMMTTVRYDELIWIITRALTDRQGLSFDQVLILLLEEGAEGRPPTLASSVFWTYGQSDEEAVPDGGLAELLKNPSREEAVRMLQRGGEMSVRIPVFAESPRLLSRVVLEKKAMLGFRAFDAEQDARLKNFGLKAYAAVPMVAKNREVGVIAVDRSLSGEPLTLTDLRDLTMLANQAGLAIENARLYDDLAQANRTLSQVRGRLIDAEKAAAQGEMGTHLAHEVRNPLVSIGGFTQRLLKKMPENDPLRKYAEVIWEEVSRVNKVLNNILDYSRNVDGLIREFQLEAKVVEAIGTLRHELTRKRIDLDVKVDPNLPPVSGDDNQIMHIVLNIVYNAAQAMGPGGGRIHVRLFETHAADESYVACEITDTGPGIPPDILPNIFAPFYTSKLDGTGLGLSIVKKIVDRYHGRIQVTNHPDHIPDSGASFTFMFPVVVQSGSFKAFSVGHE